MSSLRNAVKSQRTHRERHQPMMRDHLGPLEKKKDYKKRARCQNEKKHILKKLHKRALTKNPDEFHFHMINSEIKDGVHIEKVEEKDISILNVKKDLTYITHRRSVEKKKIEKLKAQLHLLGSQVEGQITDTPQNEHIIFVDTEKEAKNPDVAKLLNTHPALISRPFNRLKTTQLSQLNISGNAIDMKTAVKERNSSYKELRRRIERENKLRILQEKLEVRRKLLDRKMKNEALPALVQEGTKNTAPVYRWPQERKK